MLAQLVVSGIAQGALYALVALAMTVVYRATTVVNFGQGDFVMAGAFVVYVLVVLSGVSFLLAATLAVALLFCFGWAVYSRLIRPIVAGPHLALAMMAIAVGYALRGLARLVWGREVLPFPKVLPQGSFTAGPVILSASYLGVTGGGRDGARPGARVLRHSPRQDRAGGVPVGAWRGPRRGRRRGSPGDDVGCGRRHGRHRGDSDCPDHAALP